MESVLAEVMVGIKAIVSFIGLISGAAVITFYILPHFAKSIHGNFLILIWVTLMLATYSFFLQDGVATPIVRLMQFMFRMFYAAIPQQYAEGIMEAGILGLSVWCLKIALFPDHHGATPSAAASGR